MAGATAATYSADALTSPGSVDVNQQQWEYAVPLVQDDAYTRSRSSHDRASNLSQSSSRSRPVPAADHHSSYRKGERPSRERNGHGYRPEDDPDNTNWIHRDKLARIESEELQQILYHRRMRPESKASSTHRGRSHEPPPSNGGMNGSYASSPSSEQHTEPWPSLRDDQPSQFIHAGMLDRDDEDGLHLMDDDRRNWDLRRPEEIAAEDDRGLAGMYRNPGLRKSSSRIPIATTSPVPIASDYVGRESPFQYTQQALTDGDEEENEHSGTGKPRRASEPTTIDTLENAVMSTSTPGSRPGSRGLLGAPTKRSVSSNNNHNKTPSASLKGRPTAGAAGVSSSTSSSTARKTLPKPRAASTNSTAGTTQRPTTRGENRAINRPEGDPPWLATMYKPDPRLPPDQQMVPTHARKLQQEQWEKEGKTPTTYDRDFAPLAVHRSTDQQPPAPAATEGEGGNEQDAAQAPVVPEIPSPLLTEKPPVEVDMISKSPKSPEPGTRPTTATGYSPMPKVHSTPPMGLTQTPKWNPPVVTAQEPPKEKSGCGCCTVM
ncbi:hypothetical protein ASPZODRAFT_151076 [Penicilliopsis zonata CBS 506.65]|uniref:TeaA receptor TeaR n=1 Tax=Penicilliopsis zonata CBS 506.65 TaxID=1073090 RepID=A0A1L9SKG8_9EURO|nr:hypothetical protein ASPZODRAFT_151076 [Penicilliopsis zonata CBS 506.65]OJJ47593.1 hypothetical protein ASPZODRAFT_151076 [Penicilliopsis zonata CBS 506.65]